jgi:RNA polymerase sigma-70 factor (ECF subfamily)
MNRPDEDRPVPPGDVWSRLMAAAQEGDGAAYRALLTAAVPWLRRIAGRSLSHPQDVEDTVQDILATVHAMRATYDPARPFRPWLAGVARNRIADAVRRRARRHARETALGDAHETFAAPEANNEHAALDLPALYAAIARLPPGQRQAIEMLKLREMSLQDTASATGLSVSALKVATHRAIRSLRRLLGGTETLL